MIFKMVNRRAPRDQNFADALFFGDQSWVMVVFPNSHTCYFTRATPIGILFSIAFDQNIRSSKKSVVLVDNHQRISFFVQRISFFNDDDRNSNWITYASHSIVEPYPPRCGPRALCCCSCMSEGRRLQPSSFVVFFSVYPRSRYCSMMNYDDNNVDIFSAFKMMTLSVFCGWASTENSFVVSRRKWFILLE